MSIPFIVINIIAGCVVGYAIIMGVVMWIGYLEGRSAACKDPLLPWLWRLSPIRLMDWAHNKGMKIDKP